jgi:hypothetical protein
VSCNNDEVLKEEKLFMIEKEEIKEKTKRENHPMALDFDG